MTTNPAIACAFEFLTHQNQFYLKFTCCSRRNSGALPIRRWRNTRWPGSG